MLRLGNVELRTYTGQPPIEVPEELVKTVCRECRNAVDTDGNLQSAGVERDVLWVVITSVVDVLTLEISDSARRASRVVRLSYRVGPDVHLATDKDADWMCRSAWATMCGSGGRWAAGRWWRRAVTHPAGLGVGGWPRSVVRRSSSRRASSTVVRDSLLVDLARVWWRGCSAPLLAAVAGWFGVPAVGVAFGATRTSSCQVPRRPAR
jgi:hypothetical protein